MNNKLWGVWTIEEKMGSGSFGTVYKAKKEELGKTYYAAIKHISLPKDQDELDELRREGNITTTESIKEYYKDTIDDLIKEIEIMYELRANENIVDYQDHLIIEKENQLGFDIYIRMELLTPLDKYLERNPIDEATVTKIGIDISKALEVCHKHNLLHRDIKPANIFINDKGIFKLGDFGVAKKLEKTTFNMSKKGTFNYMSPEIYKGDIADIRSDIYSLGIVMYRMLNNNRAPFIDSNTTIIKASDNEQALIKRMNGELLPEIEGINKNLLNVINTACSYTKENRYSNPKDMKNDLIKITENKTESFSQSYEKTVSIYNNKEDYDKTVSIYDKDANQETSKVENKETSSGNTLETMLSGTTSDEELRQRIRQILEEERNPQKFKKLVQVDVLTEKCKKVHPTVTFIISAIMAFLLVFGSDFSLYLISNKEGITYSLIETLKEIDYLSVEIFLLIWVCFMMLVAFILSVIGKKGSRHSKKMYLLNIILTTIMSILLYTKMYKIGGIVYLLYLSNTILLFIQYKWNIKTEKLEVSEEHVEYYKENYNKLQKEYEQEYSKKEMNIVLKYISVLCALVIIVIFGTIDLPSQSNLNLTNNTITIKTEYINIRENASTYSNKLGRVYEGEEFNIISTYDSQKYTWYEIETRQGIHGYVGVEKKYHYEQATITSY